MGSGVIYRLFHVSGLAYAVGFNQILQLNELGNKGFSLPDERPDLPLADSQIWEVAFDCIEKGEDRFGNYQHVPLGGLAAGKVLINVARTINEHYSYCRADAYVFSAARDFACSRQLDLTELYDNLLGLGSRRTSPIITLPGMRCYRGLGIEGRGYVITLHHR